MFRKSRDVKYFWITGTSGGSSVHAAWSGGEFGGGGSAADTNKQHCRWRRCKYFRWQRRRAGGGRRWRPYGPLPLLKISCVTHAPGALSASEADLVALLARECARGTALLSLSSLWRSSTVISRFWQSFRCTPLCMFSTLRSSSTFVHRSLLVNRVCGT